MLYQQIITHMDTRTHIHRYKQFIINVLQLTHLSCTILLCEIALAMQFFNIADLHTSHVLIMLGVRQITRGATETVDHFCTFTNSLWQSKQRIAISFHNFLYQSQEIHFVPFISTCLLTFLGKSTTKFVCSFFSVNEKFIRYLNKKYSVFEM